ncbi:MAG: hypothetical protein ACYS8Z_18270 [Planctomycetota bacterium]|jgi:hypothetical protein
MKPADEIRRLFKNAQLGLDPDADEKVFEDVFDAHKETTENIPAAPDIWRVIMKSPLTRISAAAVLVLAAYLCMQIPKTFVHPAYALQDTIEAHNSIRYLHVKGFISFAGDKWDSESWMEFDEYGKLRRFRHQAEQFTTSLLGPLNFVDDSDASYIWLPDLNLCLKRSSESGIPSHLLQREITGLDPKLAFEKLRRQAEDGEIILDVNEPDQKNQPIVLVVTFPPQSLSAEWKKVLYVDQATRLVKKEEKFRKWGNHFYHVLTTEFFDYNQQIDPQMFNIKEELPENVTMIDQSELEYGLAQGDMTDEEVATELTSQFVHAVLEKDFDKAGRLFAGLPGSLTEKMLDAKVLKILSLGRARPDSDPDLSQMICQGTALVEMAGKYFELDANIRVAPLTGQPGRWTICRVTGTGVKPASPELIPKD